MVETLSLCMIVKNEERVIARSLESVNGLVNEIIVVDTGSTDETKNIARSFGAKVYDYTWNNNFSDARNFALKHSTSSWNLVLDADEFIDNCIKDEIISFINNEEKSIGKIEIINKFLQESEIKYSRSFVSRLFPAGIKFKGRIHEQLDSTLPRKIINLVVQHDGYYLTNKSYRNIPLLLEEVKSKSDNIYYLFQLAKEYQKTKNYELAITYFEKSYVLLNGNEAYYPSLVINYLYTLKDNSKHKRAFKIVEDNQTRLNEFTDFHFVKALIFMEMIFNDVSLYGHLLDEIENCYLKCIELGENRKNEIVVGTGTYMAIYNLGVFYETTGQVNKAKNCYQRAVQYEYKPAIDRLELV